MSRTTVFKSNRIQVVMGMDHVIGEFIQVFDDDDLYSETPEGEGLILDWSQAFGFETNLTGIPNSKYEKYPDFNAMFIALDYLKQEEPEEYEKELGKALGMFDTYRKTLMN